MSRPCRVSIASTFRAPSSVYVSPSSPPQATVFSDWPTKEATMDAFYEKGLEEATSGNVQYRKSRAAVCGCQDETEFAAKLWCLRRAFHQIISEKRNREWLIAAGRQIMCGMLRHDKKDTKEFVKIYDQIIEFMEDEVNREIMREELGTRKITHLGIWDIVIDFILLDAFDDISSPPSAIVAVFSNRFMPRRMKETSLSTILWAMISAKRKRLVYPDGFMSKFYTLTTIMAPPLALAFFGGSTTSYRELCYFFKKQIIGFVKQIFSYNYNSMNADELAEKVYTTLHSTVEILKRRLDE
uniref:Bestrophin homolog n=1 Tax=Steinernema glaseri TaxID=37863 RepID=A0A1I7XY10_9BILA